MKGLSQQDGKYMRRLRVKSLIAKSPLTWRRGTTGVLDEERCMQDVVPFEMMRRCRRASVLVRVFVRGILL